MGEAILSGLLSDGVASRQDLVVAEPDERRRGELSDVYGVDLVATGNAAAGAVGTVVLAVKPQVIDLVVSELASNMTDPPPLVMSIAAGVPTRRLEALLPTGTRVVRVMPNTPAMIGRGVSAISPGSRAGDDAVGAAETLFGALGETVVVDEALQDVVTGVSGSGPAYVAIFVRALAAAGAESGLEPDVAYRLALETVRGTSELLAETGQLPDELVEAVSSPGGTTIAAREALADGGFEQAVRAAVTAAVVRAGELGAG
jgi:pyrroline-5-carboxylate reductase